MGTIEGEGRMEGLTVGVAVTTGVGVGVGVERVWQWYE